ncbi:MAG: trigger factor [Elusimicrobiota bacterium]|jgi:trigger factor|nr:trigger factor [Elusimicrobiota bacterium]
MVQTDDKIQFSSSVKDKTPVSISMEVKVPCAAVDDEIKKTLVKIQSEAKVDGFRAGKAPIGIIEEKYFNQAKNEAVENIVKKTIFSAMEKENFIPMNIPIVDEFDYESGKDLNYFFTAECHPIYEVNDYKNIPIEKEVFRITDASLAESLEALRKSNPKLIPLSEGDISNENSFVAVDYDGFYDGGEPIKEISAKNQLLDLSAENTLKEFKEGLKGVKIGDEKDIKINYPEDYPNKLIAGKTVVFKTKVVGIKGREFPKLDDDFAKDMGLVNLDELKNKVKETIEAQEKKRQDAKVEENIMDYLLEKNIFEVPKSFLKNKEEQLTNRMRDYLQKHNESKEYINKEIEKSKDKLSREAEKSIRLSYILNFICDRENLDVNENDFEEDKRKMKEMNPNRDKEVDEYFQKNKENIMTSLKEAKILKLLVDNASIKEIVKDMPLAKEKK